MAGDVDHADVGGVDAADDPQRLHPVLDEIVGVRVDPDVDAFAFEDRHQFLHGPEERPFGFLGLLGPAGELGVDHVDAEVDGDLDDTLPVAHRGFAGVLVRARTTAAPAAPTRCRHRASAQAFAELCHQVVVGTRVVEERDEVPVRRELQVLVTQFGHQRRELEQFVIVVKRRRVEGDLHVTPP